MDSKNLLIKLNWKSYLSQLLILSLLLSTSGCAAMFRGSEQTFRVVTDPPGKTVTYQGRTFSDGEYITIHKEFDPPRINTGEGHRPVLVQLHYDPDPLLICDAALLLVFIIPGVVALGVDFGTGAWRDVHDPQVFYVPDYVADESRQEQPVVQVAAVHQDEGPPPWAPAKGHPVHYKYRYYASASIYFDMERRIYFYCNDGIWIASATLPSGIQVGPDSYVILDMGTDKPYKFHSSVVKHYSPGHVKKFVKGKGNGNGKKGGKKGGK